jgi:hypothetical protein
MLVKNDSTDPCNFILINRSCASQDVSPCLRDTLHCSGPRWECIADRATMRGSAIRLRLLHKTQLAKRLSECRRKQFTLDPRLKGLVGYFRFPTCNRFSVMSEYQYSPLSVPTAIRLLRLLPSDEHSTDLKCELFEYPLGDSDTLSHPYEALSYVWGSEKKPESITVNNQNFSVTKNLHAALLRLRDRFCCRVIWADAICIHQGNSEEKEKQLPLMPEIYAKARHVVVWLGETADNSGLALNALQTAADSATRLSELDLPKEIEVAILRLLRRPWFTRIWVRTRAPSIVHSH